MHDETTKILESLIEPIIEPLIKKFENFDFRYYSKFENEIKKDIEKKFDGFEKTDGVSDLIINFLQSSDFHALFEIITNSLDEKRNELIKSDKRAPLIFGLIEKADAIIPNISFLIFSRVNAIEHIRKMCEPIDLLEEIEKYDGEHRARLTVRFFREVSEFLYDNYIRILWEFTCVINKQTEVISNGNFGQLIDGLISRLTKENAIEIIEQDAGWIRNASCHARYTYQNSSDSLLMWDKNKPKKEISVKELLEKAVSMYSVSSQLIFDIYICNVYKVILNNEIIDILINEKDKLLKLDKDVLILLESKIENHFKDITKVKLKRK